MIDSENNQSYKRILNAWFPTRVRLTRQYVAGTCAGFGLGLMVESAIVARGWHLLVAVGFVFIAIGSSAAYLDQQKQRDNN